MRVLKLSLVVVAAASVAACAGAKQRAMLINPGDSKSQVIEVMGEPDDRQFEGSQEALQYGMVVSIGVCDYTVVWLRNGIATGVTSYRHFSTMGCRSGLKAVKWEDPPDQVIELRSR